ncbi:MAG: Uma2 family endonuclease [Armatimonadota bacterium]|nr:Uma2 family endonuclease [Armatimonadota bacterium]
MTAVLEKPQAIPVSDADAEALRLREAIFQSLTDAYPELRLEQSAEGEIIVMPPPGFDTGKQNADLTADLVIWNRQAKLGQVLNSDTLFVLPSGATRGPDAAWVEQSRVDALTAEQRRGRAPLCPDFVLELLSPSDRLVKTQEKMREYLANGARFGWLVNPRDRTVEIYRPGREVEVLNNPATVSGEDVLPGFVQEMSNVWD